LGFAGGDNFYQYAPNPVGWVDPFGLMADDCSDDVVEVNVADVNYSQRTINKRFDIPDGKKKINAVIKEGPNQVKDFPPIDVKIVDGQMVAIDGNSRLTIAEKTGAIKIKAKIKTDIESAKELSRRTRRNNLPRTGTCKIPEAK